MDFSTYFIPPALKAVMNYKKLLLAPEISFAKDAT